MKKPMSKSKTKLCIRIETDSSSSEDEASGSKKKYCARRHGSSVLTHKDGSKTKESIRGRTAHAHHLPVKPPKKIK